MRFRLREPDSQRMVRQIDRTVRIIEHGVAERILSFGA